MILLDTNVLIDEFDPSARLHAWAINLIRSGLLGEGVAINPLILAELCFGDDNPDIVATRLETLGIVILDLPSAASPCCAQAYSAYLENRRTQNTPAAPKIPLPDFFIGAHASFLSLPPGRPDQCPHPRRTMERLIDSSLWVDFTRAKSPPALKEVIPLNTVAPRHR